MKTKRVNMTLEEAIEQVEEVANIYEGMINDSLHSQTLYKKRANEYKQFTEWLRELQRARVLLKATHDLLKAAKSMYVEDALMILVHYDDADCDGYCLMEDIENYFDEFDAERRTDE